MKKLEYLDQQLMKCERSIKEIDFLLENLHAGFETGLIKSKKIYKHYLESYTIKKKEIEAQQDGYFRDMVRLKPLADSKNKISGNAWTGGVV